MKLNKVKMALDKNSTNELELIFKKKISDLSLLKIIKQLTKLQKGGKAKI